MGMAKRFRLDDSRNILRKGPSGIQLMERSGVEIYRKGAWTKYTGDIKAIREKFVDWRTKPLRQFLPWYSSQKIDGKTYRLVPEKNKLCQRFIPPGYRERLRNNPLPPDLYELFYGGTGCLSCQVPD